MTSSRLFVPAPSASHVPWLTLFALVGACLVGAIILSHFVAALHLSMARGETLRAQQRMAGVADVVASQRQSIEHLRLAQSNR